VDVARQFGFGHVDLRHILHHTSSTHLAESTAARF
jgi:hypothetical protein